MALAGIASANEHHFGYVYESGVLAPGAKEIEEYNTWRAGREDFYSALDHRLSFEVGVAEHLMTAFYLNFGSTTFDPGNDTLQTAFAWQGVSSEWKWKLLDPAADPVGLALYAELTFNTDGMELEPKLILDKAIGPWLLAANVFAEFEYEAQPDGMELAEIAPDLSLGLSREIAKGMHAGLELHNHNAILKSGGGGDFSHQFSSLYLGPVFSYATEGWWMTFSVLPQWPALSKKSGGSILELDDGEKINARLLFSFHV
jgi:hypothetical protein